jgi:hypothetical protein
MLRSCDLTAWYNRTEEGRYMLLRLAFMSQEDCWFNVPNWGSCINHFSSIPFTT